MWIYDTDWALNTDKVIEFTIEATDLTRFSLMAIFKAGEQHQNWGGNRSRTGEQRELAWYDIETERGKKWKDLGYDETLKEKGKIKTRLKTLLSHMVEAMIKGDATLDFGNLESFVYNGNGDC